MKPIQLIFSPLFFMAGICIQHSAIASDKLITLTHKSESTSNTLSNENITQLGADGVFDSEGKPININPPSLALEYYADEALVERSWGSKTKVNPSYKSKTKVSSALKAPKVANDPSCRWLDNRISYLQRKLRPGTQNQQHFEREMTARLGEWKCLKCETKGPSQGDHALCQYKR
ncbi:hypothetical protein [Shewanella subflava]|uniref:Uncharacterized protein n=1 Tax=Shewanella subflava TaxID=2986476 RepID=A0ABT3I7Z3_9GAMM|nr:hypothetical protein [Shewanella subflava]MCW3172186.1 hypothetical protein [Shewanella subflava]